MSVITHHLIVVERLDCSRHASGVVPESTTNGSGVVTVNFVIQSASQYAGYCDKISGDMTSTLNTRKEFAYTVLEPLGGVGVIPTWNGPLISTGRKVITVVA